MKLNAKQVPPEEIVPYLLYLWFLAASVPGLSNLFSGSDLNALDLSMECIAELATLHTHIVWVTSVQSKLSVDSSTRLMMNWNVSRI